VWVHDGTKSTLLFYLRFLHVLEVHYGCNFTDSSLIFPTVLSIHDAFLIFYLSIVVLILYQQLHYNSFCFMIIFKRRWCQDFASSQETNDNHPTTEHHEVVTVNLRSLNTKLNVSNLTFQPIPLNARHKTWVCGRSLTGIAGSNPADDMDVRFLWEFVLSGRVLFDELITCPEESYRLWCVVLRDVEASWMRRLLFALGHSAKRKNLTFRPTLLCVCMYVCMYTY
jgi:hypothetical protein